MSPRKKSKAKPSSEPVPCTTVATLSDELASMHGRVVDRAHEIFRGHGRLFERALDDWLTAEREFFVKPAVTVEEADGSFTIEVDAAGIDPADLDVQVTPDQILVRSRAETRDVDRDAPGASGRARRRELFRTIRLPRSIDPGKVTAEANFGLLRITAPLTAGAGVRHIPVAA